MKKNPKFYVKLFKLIVRNPTAWIAILDT